MRILVVHNFYQHPGGEDVVFKQEKALLATTEDVFSLTFRNRKGWRGAWQTLWSPWNIWAARRVKQAIKHHRPEVIHIHNLHYAAGPIVVRMAKRMGVPIVMTLHNYRLLCPSATLFHDGRVFTDSLHSDFPWKAIRYGVHSHSVLKTAWLALTNWVHRKAGTWRMVDRYITLTDFAKQLFISSSFGVAAEKFATKPNFATALPGTDTPRGDHFLFVGRLTQEKGIQVLLDAFAGTGYQLRIAGEGPLKDWVLDAARRSPNITYLGSLDSPAINQELAVCTALLFPSIWYEGLPMTLVEAFAAGTPVIASDLGAMQSLVDEGQNGWRFAPDNAVVLRKKVAEWLNTDPAYKAEISRHALETYQRHYTAERNKALLLACYHATKRNP